MNSLLRVENLTKRFPGVVASDRLNFEVAPGEIHALLGENGAGKSTLMNMLYGMLAPDEGTIFWKGRRVRLRSPRDAIQLGIGMVHQHFMQVGALTVLENVMLGRARGLLPDGKAAEARLRQLATEFDQPLEAHAVVNSLSVGQRQRLEIIKALYHDAELLILDEPTAVLTPPEIERLFSACRRIAAQGRSVLFITHRLDEVEALSNRITVLRQGRAVGTFPASGFDRRETVRLMVGRDIVERVALPAVKRGEAVLTIERLQVSGSGSSLAVRDLSLTVCRGEILGVAGVDGNGQTELIEAILALRENAGGTIRLGNRDITNSSTAERLRLGMAVIPSDRHAAAIIEDFSLVDNALLGVGNAPRSIAGRWFRTDLAARFAGEIVRDYQVKTPSLESPLRTLSGGHQQRFVLGRTLARSFDLLLAAQPTRGLDVGSAAFVRGKLAGLREQGKAVLLVSMDLDEVLMLSDRIVVMYDGRITGEFRRPFDRTALGLAITVAPTGATA